MEINQQIISSSSSHEDPVHQSEAADDVTFRFNHLQIDTINESNTQPSTPESPEPDDHDDDEEADFTFACVTDNDSPEPKDQIRTVFPLFDQTLLFSGDSDAGNRRLPIEVPVDKVFIETDGTVHALSKPTDSGTPELNTKSNSTGFSKLWRFRNVEMNRSNSDSRDAFVFLEGSSTATSKANTATGYGKTVKKGANIKKSGASAHEVYLKQKGQTEDERRRSYLPYRPGLMGFFTNVNGGLSKNVHPF